MCRAALWLLASLAFASLASLADGAPLQVMAAPNLLRVGTAENIFVECQDCTGGDIRVEIKVLSHPTKTKMLATTSVTLNGANSFQSFGQITIPAGEFSKDPNMKQYVYLQAQFPDHLLEKVVLVSFQSGYIFIQTDKTLYTPDSEGSLRSGIYSGKFRLGEIVSPGLWKVVTRFHSHPQQSFSTQFEVKEYMLPRFEVKLMPLTAFFYADSKDFTVDIKATYLFGKEVDGTAYVVFGVVQEGQKNSFPSSLQRVPVENGLGQVKLRREHITRTFPNINELVGKSIYVAVSVLTDSGSEMVEAELRGIQIVTSPYTIHFKKTPKYFKPGMSFDVTILSRGQLVKHGRHQLKGQILISLPLPITKEMLPSFRIIAYYHTVDNEVVSDSVWVDVKDSCMGSLKLESSRPAPTYGPRRMFGLKVWDQIEKYDTGCTPVKLYKEGLQRDCCLDGMRDTPLSYTCEVRSEYITDGTVCVEAFIHCCKELEKQRAEMKHDSLILARSEEDDSYMDSNEIVTRTNFPESWLFIEIDLPACPSHTPDCGTTVYERNIPLKDSITTWEFTGISLSRTHGICVGDPLEVIVRRDFFIDLRLPYSAVRGEQIEVKAILHNYSRDRLR
eukprot:superscaffoldBa00008730_g23590